MVVDRDSQKRANPKIRVLGVDCGSHSTGYGIIETDEHSHQLVVCGVIRLPAKEALNKKLLQIHQELDQLIRRYQPDVVAVEDQFYLTNFKSVLKLGQVKGVVILTAAQAGIPVSEYSPLEIKAAVTGYGRADKYQVQVMVQRLLGMDTFPKSHDAADALALAICHTHSAATTNKIEKGKLGVGQPKAFLA